MLLLRTMRQLAAKCSAPKNRSRAVIVLLMALAGCATSSLPPSEHHPMTSLSADSNSILGAAEADLHLAPGMSGFRPIAQGAVDLDARIALINNAKVSVDYQTYLLSDDKTGRLVLRSLRDAAARGVRVRLIVDDFYAEGEDPLFAGLAAYPNAYVRLFNPFLSGRNGGLARSIAFFSDFNRLNHRAHNKMMVVDGVMAVAGGRNTADEYFFRNGSANFIDFDVLVTGDLVHHLGELFDTYWNSDEVVPIEKLDQALASADARRATFDELVNLQTAPAPEVPVGLDLFHEPAFSTALIAHQLHFVVAPATAHADSPLKASPTLSNTPEAEDTVRKRAMAFLPQTQSELIMFSPYFIPGDAGIEEFARLRAKGVDIKVITNSLPTSDEPLVNVGYEHYRYPLVKMGAKVYELSSTRLTKIPFMHRALGQSKGQLHAKMGFIDRQYVLIGSMNMDPRSAKINTELGVSIHSPELAKMILAVYQVDHLEGAYQVIIKPGTDTIQWQVVNPDGSGGEVLDEEPDSDAWQRINLYLQHLIVGDDQL